jgi:hypothetical protein
MTRSGILLCLVLIFTQFVVRRTLNELFGILVIYPFIINCIFCRKFIVIFNIFIQEMDSVYN